MPSQHEPLVQWLRQSPAWQRLDSAPSTATRAQLGTASRSVHWRSNSALKPAAKPGLRTSSVFSSFLSSPDSVQFIEPNTTAASGVAASATAHLECDLPPQFSTL